MVMIIVRRSGRVTLLDLRMFRVSGFHRCGGRRVVVVRLRAVRVRAVVAVSLGIVLVVPHSVSLVEGFPSARDRRPWLLPAPSCFHPRGAQRRATRRMPNTRIGADCATNRSDGGNCMGPTP